MIEPERILVTNDGPVRILTLNRAAELNPFDGQMHRSILRIFDELADDSEARAVVLTGAGRAFSAGGDVSGFTTMADDIAHRRQTLRLGRRLFDDLIGLHLPLITAVNGPAVGLGATLVTASDIVFMAEGSYLADTHVLVALVAGDGGAITWPTLTSLLKAKQYLLTGDRVPASDAVAMGLANFVVAPEDLVPAAVAFAHRIAALAPQAVQDTKVLLNQVLRQGSALSLGFGLAAESQSSDTAEYRRVPAEMAERRQIRDAERKL